MNKLNIKIADFLKIEIEQLNSGISEYSSKIYKTAGGTIALGIAIVWYSIQKPEAKGILALVGSFGLHAVIINLVYYYVVYRTLKETKRIQAERVNRFFNKTPILVWEEVWNRIWGSHKMGHSKLAWFVLVLFISAFAIVLTPTIILASEYILHEASTIRICFLAGYLALMLMLPFFEIRVAYNYISKIGNDLEEYRSHLCRIDGENNVADSAKTRKSATD